MPQKKHKRNDNFHKKSKKKNKQKRTQFLLKAKLFIRKFAYSLYEEDENKRNIKAQRKLSTTKFKKLQILCKKFRPKKNIRWQGWKIKTPTHVKKRQRWLNNAYNIYIKIVPINLKKDFLNTIVGKLLISTHSNTYALLPRWLRQNQLQRLWQAFRVTNFGYLPIIQTNSILGEIYEQAIKYQTIKSTRWKKRKYTFHRISSLARLSQDEHKKTPWLTSLLFSRNLYKGSNNVFIIDNINKLSKMKPYLRRKDPEQTKHKQLYNRYRKIINNEKNIEFSIQKDKRNRINNIIYKLLQPFYGKLTKKQLKNIWQKIKIKKSTLNSKLDNLFATFEKRLDILVYRLNLAPNILWARRLIWQGTIFVTNVNTIKTWVQLYASLKLYAYPLKLRDPKKLYKNKYWNPQCRQSRYKFILEPIRKINYIVKSHEIIQYNPQGNLNKFKINSSLYNKTIPNYLLTKFETQVTLSLQLKEIKESQIRTEAQNYCYITSAFLLFEPKIEDLTKNDRIKELFLRWAVL
jgi:ribosomal protein S4